jgi:MFS family permease
VAVIAQPREAAWRAHRSDSLTLALLSLCWFGFFFGTLAPIPVIQVLRVELHTNTTWAAWAVNALQLVAAIAAPLLGRVSDRFGTKRVLTFCCAMFSVGSMAAVLHWNIWGVIGWRGVQGIGAGLIPLSAALVKDTFPSERLSFAFSTLAAASAAGTVRE